MAMMEQEIRVIADEPVTRAFWERMFGEWKSGGLRERWAREHPDLFDPMDLGINQPDKYFAEWYAAILLKQTRGLLSLVCKYGHHGHRSHPRKQEVLKRCLTPEHHQYVITPPQQLFGNSTCWPDLFVYKPDCSSCFFCEVKGPKDRLRDVQLLVFEKLHEVTGIEIVLFKFRYAT